MLFRSQLEKELPAYKIIRKYRYGNNIFTTHINVLKKYNEATPIITNLKVLTNKNYHLPWLPKNIKELQQALFKYRSITPRVLTESLLQLPNNELLKVMNTHLEKRVITIKKAQLKRIQKVIEKSMHPIILMGDFNMGLDNPTFQEFTKKLSEYHLKRVDIKTKTWKSAKKEIAIDHIFIPENCKVLEQKIQDNTISDHYMIIVKIAFEI